MEESFYFALPLTNDAHQMMYGLENYITETEDFQADVFNFDCAIIVFPTTDQIGHLQHILKELFDETMSDNTKYYDMVRKMIESNGIPVVSVTRECIKLTGTSRSWNMILRKEHLPPWNLIFFKAEKEPLIVPPADLSDSLIKEYFSCK